MEKRNPSYHLKGIQMAFQTVSDLRLTRTARRTITELGLNLEDTVMIIQSLEKRDFYKSMTTYADHRVWQDVYHANFNGLALYIKFAMDNEGHLIVSFKDR